MIEKSSATSIKPNLPRIAYLDNLKALAVILVVVIHTAVTYSDIGSWVYEERRSLDSASFYFFLFFQAFLQAFFMSLLFIISGYFIPDSLARKGRKKFITARMFRLGVPTLVFALLIGPICQMMAVPYFTLKSYLHGIITFKFIEWTGPLWFNVALLIFTFIYLACKRECDVLVRKYAFNITFKNILALIFLITIVAFGIRLIFPIGTSVMNLQLCFFSAYIFMFFLGIFAKEKNIFEKISYEKAKKWFIAAFAIGVPFFIWNVYFFFGSSRDIASADGGWHWAAFDFALWESFICVAVILGLLGIFKERFNTQNSLQKFLSANSFGVYVFHPPVVIVVSILIKNVDWPPILKFALVVPIVLPLSFILAHFIRKIPLLRKIFS